MPASVALTSVAHGFAAIRHRLPNRAGVRDRVVGVLAHARSIAGKLVFSRRQRLLPASLLVRSSRLSVGERFATVICRGLESAPGPPLLGDAGEGSVAFATFWGSQSAMRRNEPVSTGTSRLIVLCAAMCVALAVSAADAAAATYVSQNAASSKGRSCSQPDYNRIQEAIAADATEIEVCPGTYTEQLAITRPTSLVAVGGAGSATVVLPSDAVDSTTGATRRKASNRSMRSRSARLER